jgi:hypothetical protein
VTDFGPDLRGKKDGFLIDVRYAPKADMAGSAVGSTRSRMNRNGSRAQCRKKLVGSIFVWLG